MTNAERILTALDHHLDHEVILVVYGRAAIAAGFDGVPEAVSRTLDVDVIIPISQITVFQNDARFWDAQEATNQIGRAHV